MADPLDRYTEGLPDITQRPTSNTLIGGPDYYDPALGRLAVTNPEMLAHLLDAKGLRAPPDVSKDFTHRDASEALLAATVQAKQARTLDPSWGALPGVGQNPNEAAQTSPTLGRPDPEMTTPGVAPGGPPPPMRTGAALDPTIPGAEGLPVRTGEEGPTPPISATVPGGFGSLSGRTFGTEGTSPLEQTAGTMDIPPPPSGSYHRSSQDVSGPTPSPESVNASGAVPGPSTSEKPGDLSKLEPSGMRMSRGGGGSAGAPVHEDKGVDGLAKAMAGLQSLTPKPFLPSTPAPYHATGQIARGTLPQALLAELMGQAKPAAQFRLGEALRGKSYA